LEAIWKSSITLIWTGRKGMGGITTYLEFLLTTDSSFYGIP